MTINGTTTTTNNSKREAPIISPTRVRGEKVNKPQNYSGKSQLLSDQRGQLHHAGSLVNLVANVRFIASQSRKSPQPNVRID